MGAREAIDDAVGGEEGVKRRVDKFTAVVTLHALDDHMELGMHKQEKALEDSGHVRFVA